MIVVKLWSWRERSQDENTDEVRKKNEMKRWGVVKRAKRENKKRGQIIGG